MNASRLQEATFLSGACPPDAIAIESGPVRLTYRETAERAGHLAEHLRSLGVAADAIVGLAVERSPELIIGVLGILGAGGAWLPLDPSYPPERLAYMLRDSGASLLIADAPAATRLPNLGIRRLDVRTATQAPDDRGRYSDAAVPETGGGARGNGLLGATETQAAAYLIYTSGSTGRPKGVLVTRRGLANLVAAQARAFGVTPGKRVLQFASASFDASVFECVMALSAGATLVLAPHRQLASGPALAEFLRAARITHATLPPAVLATVPVTELPALEVLVCAGEALPEALAARWGSRRRLCNAYGPTEATVWATLADVRPASGKPSIGRAIEGAHVMVLNSRLQPVPAGEPGELAVGGLGVARGYHGRPSQTAERFVPDPFGTQPGGRLYLTGDLVRLRPDGELEFLGRADDQIKLRGFRIEPDEIACVLREHPDVGDAVVVARRDDKDRLVAYVTSASTEADPRPDVLRAFLAAKLPMHMMPSDVMVVAAFPLTLSGKVDRSALPAPDPAAARLPAGRTPPRTTVEKSLARLIGTLLGMDEVAADDDFFALGGHSLLAGRLAAQVRAELGLELALPNIYRAPTVAGMAAMLSSQPDGLAPPPIIPCGAAHPIPLSLPQERVWFLQQLAPGSIAYNAQATIELHGPLIRPALEAALGEIVRRHEILRTAFREVDGVPAQEVRPPMPVRLPVVDLADLPAETRSAYAEDAIQDAVRGTFDLARPPLARWLLLRLSAAEHVLVHVEHHLVHDGWSFALFLDELQAIYEAFARGLPSPLPEPEVQYRDFAFWQRQWLRGDVLRRYLAYWTSQLAAAPPALDLPTDRPRPKAQSFRGSALRIDLPPQLCRRLREFSRDHGVTLFTSMLAGFAVLLRRYTGQTDLLVGSGVANRRLAEVERMIGMVVNTLVLRIDLAGDPSFAELLERVHRILVAAHDWQDMPFDKLVEALAPPRDPSRNPLFQVMFSFHDSPVPELNFAGLRGAVRERHNGSAKTDLNVVVIPQAEQRAGRRGGGRRDAPITLIWEYASDLFDEATMRRMVAHYERLLAAAIQQPGRDVARLPLLSSAERRVVLREWNRAGTPYDADRVIHELFQEQAEHRPDAVAVVDTGRSLTYGELDARANRLAHFLRQRGVGCDVPVGVMLQRGAEMITAMLAVIKAGGAYLPLDPAYPAHRLAQMLTGVAALVVTRSDHATLLPAGTATVVKLDEEEEALACAPTTCPASGVKPRNLAYVLYTSGSTGRPKGVMVEHRCVLRLVRGANYMEFGQSERFAQVADASFDALTFELWGALLHGGAVCVIPTADLLSPGRLGQQLRRHRVSSMFLTSALFNEVMAGHPKSFAGLTNLIVGGEALNPGPIRELAAGVCAPRRLLNGYGPTETTTFAACHLIGDLSPAAASIPIGQPIANTSLYVVDQLMQPVPVGVAGELYIGGPGVARGYVGQPGLTAERFVPNPFAADGSRLYRTGDLARWRPEGVVEFLGRADDQVKIRGFRVEPGEVQAALETHPALARAAVVAQEDTTGRRLVAYVVADTQSAAPSASELRAFLANSLPAYMHPAVYVYLDALPLSIHGKVDRAALPSPVTALGAPPRGLLSDDMPATTTIQRRLADLWVQLLGIRDVRMQDDFFVLGGHSLLAMRLVTRVNQEFGTSVRLGRFLEAPTLARLAGDVEVALGASPAQPPIRSEAGHVLSYQQQRLWFLDQLEPGQPVYNVPLSYRIRGSLNIPALNGALSEVVRRHEVLRTVFRTADGTPRQAVLPAERLRIPVMDLQGDGAPELAAARISTDHARASFDLATGPLLRPLLLRLRSTDHWLLLTMHHIVCDGWSIGLLCQEVSALYQAYLRAPHTSLPEPRLQYADYAEWQMQYVTAAKLDSLLIYWRAKLAGIPELASLPTDHPRPPVQSYRGAHATFDIPGEVAAGAADLARQTGATPFAVLLAAFGTFLVAYTGGTEVVVGTPVAGRQRSELEGLIGLFANTLVLRLDVAADRTFAEQVVVVRDEVRAAIAHQDLPFERLVDELHAAPSPAYNPLFQILFSYYEQDPEDLRLAGCDVEMVAGDTGTAKFDLSVNLTHSDGALSGRLEYSTDLFDRATIERFVDHYQAILAGAVAAPGAPVSNLTRLTASDEQRLVGWNCTETDLGAPATLPELIAAQAARTPGAHAVYGTDGSLSYAEFESRVCGLARLLRAHGVRTGDVIGVFLEPSISLVVAVHAVQAAGAAYLPLEPGHPDKRLAFMIADCRCPLVITNPALAERAARLNARLIILNSEVGDVDNGPGATAAEGGWPLSVDTQPEALAYVIYTSGSTGTPKGVGIPHRAIVNRLRWMQQAFALGPGDRVLQKTPFSFDVSVWELFWPLMTGAAMVTAPPGWHRDPANLIELIRANEVTTMHFVPSMLAAFLDEPGLAIPLDRLRRVICSGETLSAALAARFHATLPNVELHNLYGPTEAAVDVTWHCCQPGEDVIPIGAPVANTRIEILDSGARRVPVGVPGELCIGGTQLAHGYIGRPGLTAERFIPNSFAREPGARLYRTGDRARWRSSGELEFLGRLDHQVKLRGHRIELGEVENALATHPSVRRVVAELRGEGATRGIVAYCVPAAGDTPATGASADAADSSGTHRVADTDGAPDAAGPAGTARDPSDGATSRALLAFARASLPDYMVPSAVVLMDKLPMTQSGKVDRRALPEPEYAAVPEFLPPGNWPEQVVAEVWEALLGRAPIGAADNFFTLGGNSLLAAKARLLLRERVSTPLSLVDMFRYPTVASLAAFIAKDHGDDGTPRAPERIGHARAQAIALLGRQRRQRSPS